MDVMQTMKELWAAVAAQNADDMRRFFSADAVVRWHATNEQFTLEEYLRANCEYPGVWQGEVLRAEQTESGSVICVAKVWAADYAMAAYCTGLYTFENGKIVLAEEYWADCSEAPQWRQQMCIGKPIFPHAL